jgi:tRNA-specific 2-thiouridylase
MEKKTVVLGMSGGVDSSVSAYLLKEQGYNVIGLFMKNWQEEDSSCSAEKDFEDVVSVCSKLDIPYYTVNFMQEYQEKVFSSMIRDFEKGLTPNPDILCNQEIKFKLFFEKALKFDADFLATGHYAQTKEGKLYKGLDPSKDQTYFLAGVQKKVLEKVLFPVGALHKKQVKEIAHQLGLGVDLKKESMGICFIGKKDFRPFLQKYLERKVGPIQTLDGKTVGEHEGVVFYTIGQRKGLKIGGSAFPYYVCKKDINNNILYVAQKEHHPALYSDKLIAFSPTWTDHIPIIGSSIKAKIRYRQEDQACTIEKIENDLLWVKFEKPVRAATPGQTIVFYDNDECLGGATIQEIGPSFYDQKKEVFVIEDSQD